MIPAKSWAAVISRIKRRAKAAGRVVTARMRTANGYTLTVQSSLGILTEVFAGVPDPGFTTPALLVGPDFASALPGSTPIRLDS